MPRRGNYISDRRRICTFQRDRSRIREAQLLVKPPSRCAVSRCTIQRSNDEVLARWSFTFSQCGKSGRKKKNCSLPSRLDNTLGTYAPISTAHARSQARFRSARSTRGIESHVEPFAWLQRTEERVMYAKRCAAFVLLVVIVGLVNATENYMDYGGKLLSCSIHHLLCTWKDNARGILARTFPFL